MFKPRLVIGILFLLLLLNALPGISGPSQDSNMLSFVGSALWTKAHDVDIQGKRAYCAFMNGLVILDISDLKNPVRISQLYLGGGLAIEVKETLAFVASGDKGLNIIDVSDPKNPVLRGKLDTEGDARDVAVDGGFAFVADGRAGLAVVDVRNPAIPKMAGAWDSPGELMGIVLREKLAYVADGSAGLQIIDVKNPEKPAPVGSLDTDGTSEGITLSGNYAYIADGSAGLKFIDVSSPSKPRQVASLSASGYAHSVSVDGRYLCAGSLYDGGYQILDVADPAAPAVVSTNIYTTYNEGWGVVLKGNLACVVDYFSGLFFMDVSAPQKPVTAGNFFTPSTIVAAAVQDRYAYAIGELSGLQVVDLSDPPRMDSVGLTSIYFQDDLDVILRGVQGLTVSGRYAYVTDRWSVKIFDVSAPAKPKPVRIFNAPGGAPRAIVVCGNTAYITADNAGLFVIDINNPLSPSVVGSYKMPRFTYGLAVEGDYAYLANSDTGFHILDIRKPAAPALVASLKLDGEPCGVAIRGDFAYVASGPAGLQIIDIGQPAAPKVRGSFPSGDFSSSVVLRGDSAYIADGNAGVLKIAIGNPAAPKLEALFDTPGEALAVALSGPLVLVADSNSLILLK
jgi:hypothetical protein